MADKKSLYTLGIAIIVLVVIIAVFGIALISLNNEKKGVNVLTDKTEYKEGEPLKVKIANNDGEEICFSSCYPYYFERKNSSWEGYNYAECSAQNIAEKCVNKKEVKAFELTLPQLTKGTHRLAIPVCVGCAVQQQFKEDQWLYSNEFSIK